MKNFRSSAGLILLFAVTRAAEADDKPILNPHLEALRPLLEKTYKGTFVGSTPDKPTVDVAHWERALNGQAVRMTHSINDGVYGGESLFFWDDARQAVTYYYFTTAGFRTTGAISFTETKWTARETVAGDAGGITEVRSSSEWLPDGALHVKSEYLSKGEWAPGHEVTYREDPTAKVTFK